MSDSTSSAPGQNARPALGTDNIYDVDAAQHFLADHAASIIVAFDHDAMDPAVNIYTATSEGALSPGDYYLWPLLHRTSERLRQEIDESRRRAPGYSWRMDVRRLPLLTTLIRIRRATIHALCRWDLTGSRPESLTVLNTRRDLTGLTMDQVSDVPPSGTPHGP
jgi:hypothetical protein